MCVRNGICFQENYEPKMSSKHLKDIFTDDDSYRTNRTSWNGEREIKKREKKASVYKQFNHSTRARLHFFGF